VIFQSSNVAGVLSTTDVAGTEGITSSSVANVSKGFTHPCVTSFGDAGTYPAADERVAYVDMDDRNLRWENLVLYKVENVAPTRKFTSRTKADRLSDTDKALVAEYRKIREEAAVAKWKAAQKTPQEMAEIHKEAADRNAERKEHRKQFMKGVQARILAQLTPDELIQLRNEHDQSKSS